MSSRHAVVVFALVVVVGASAWFFSRTPEVESPPPPVVGSPESAVGDIVPPPREAPATQFDRALALLQSVPPPHDPREADALSKPVLDRSAAAKVALLGLAASRPEERQRLEAQVQQLTAAERKYEQMLLRAGEEWLNASVNLPRSAENPDALARVRKRMLRDGITNPLRDDGLAATALEHLRRAQLTDIVHRVAGKDHGDAAELVTHILAHRTAAERLEAIDDEEADAAQVHAAWRGELAGRFAKNEKYTPSEVAACLLSGCFSAAKPDKPSGADFAFLDPARNPELVSAVEKGPIRRILVAWSANHAADPAATAAAAALLKASEKK